MYLITILAGQEQSLTGSSLTINGEPVTIREHLIFVDENQNVYISINDFVRSIPGHSFHHGQYRSLLGDRNKGYVENANEIMGFEVGTNIMYKIEPGAITDFAYFEMESNIISENDRLYINITDIPKALSMRVRIYSR